MPRPRGKARRRQVRTGGPWRAIRRVAGAIAAAVVLALIAFALWTMLRGRPQDLPWTPLDLGDPVGAATGRKLAALTRDFPQCRALLDRAGIRYTALAPVSQGDRCGYDDAVRLLPGGARGVAFRPAGVGMSCPVAAATAIWEWTSVQPAALRHFRARVVEIEHFGSYNCRRMYGRTGGSWSQHATADAIDIAGFRLSDGTRITVVGDWNGAASTAEKAKAAFLHDVRDGACRLFATTLSPDYNEAHRDHLHLDQADRGAMAWRSCR